MNRHSNARNFRARSVQKFSAPDFAKRMADSLGKIFGYGVEGAPGTAAVADVNLATAKNWHMARSGMHAHNLANLCAQSDEVLAEFLEAIGRADLADAARRDAVIGEIKSLLETLESR